MRKELSVRGANIIVQRSFIRFTVTFTVTNGYARDQILETILDVVCGPDSVALYIETRSIKGDADQNWVKKPGHRIRARVTHTQTPRYFFSELKTEIAFRRAIRGMHKLDERARK